MSNDQPIAYVKGKRSDGKYTVTYVFPLSGRKISKIRTYDQLLEDYQSGNYRFVGFSPDHYKGNPTMARYSRNVAGYMDSSGRFRPIRDDDDYDPGRLAPESLIKESKRVQRSEGLTRGGRGKGKGRGKRKGKRNPTLYLPPYFRLSYSPTTGEYTLYRRGQYEGTFSTKEAARKRAWDINSFAPITSRKRAGKRNPISARIMKGIETATSFLKSRGFPVDRLKVVKVGAGKVGVKAEGARGAVRFTVKD